MDGKEIWAQRQNPQKFADSMSSNERHNKFTARFSWLFSFRTHRNRLFCLLYTETLGEGNNAVEIVHAESVTVSLLFFPA